jgi:hypothetical protein
MECVRQKRCEKEAQRNPEKCVVFPEKTQFRHRVSYGIVNLFVLPWRPVTVAVQKLLKPILLEEVC